MKENSREEDITKIKQRIEDVKEYIEYGLPYSEYLDLENSFDNILSDYKRVLKENEELNNRCKNLDEEAQAYVEELMGDSTLKDRIINRLNKENEELKAKWDKDTHILQNKLDYANADRVDLAQQNKELRSRIPSLENGTYTGDIEGLLKLEKEIVKRDNEIKQLKEEISQYKKIKEISENITLEDVEKAAQNYEKDYILREKVKEIAHELYYNNYKGNLDDGKFAQKMAKKLEKVLKESGC